MSSAGIDLDYLVRYKQIPVFQTVRSKLPGNIVNQLQVPTVGTKSWNHMFATNY